MYIRPAKKKRSSPIRVIILLLLDALGIYVLVWRRDLIRPIQIGPTPTPTPSATDIMAEAQELYVQGLLDDAMAKYSEAAALDPTSPTPYVWWSYLLTLRRHTAEAVEKARQAVGIAPDNAEALAALCMALDWDAAAGDQAKLEEALSTCLSATDVGPGYAEGHAYLAEVYADLGQSTRAVESARLAVTLNDGSVFAHRDLGYALEKQRKYKESISEYRRASQLHPRLAQPYIDLGRVQMARGQYKEALSAFEKATVVDPRNGHALDSLGWALIQTGDYQRARVVLQKAVEADPLYVPAYGHLGLASYVLTDYEGAAAAFKKALDLGATDREYYYELGLAYAYLGRCDEARPWLLKALEADPTLAPAQEGLRLCPEKKSKP